MNSTPLANKSDSIFLKHLILTIVFFVATPITIFSSLFSLISLTKPDIHNRKTVVTQKNLIQQPKSGIQVYASLPSEVPSISGEPNIYDARSEIIRQYLREFHSPLEPYADKLVGVADKYDVDYRLLTAIAQQESNLCKKIPDNTYNCWGWGIHSQGTLGFKSFDEGIEEVTRGLRENYINLGLFTLEDIMSKYTPLSPGTWAQGVDKFMQDMEQHNF